MPEYRRAQYIGRVFQDPMMGTAANMQIEENLALAARRGKKRTLRWGVTKAEREEYHEKLKSFGLGLEDRMTAKVGLLSGGQRQALTLLMASLQKPKLLLLDDMLNALEPGTQVPVHRHMETAETTICIEGYLEVVLYAEASGQDETGGERKFVEVSRVTLCPREGKYGVQIPLGVWHSVDVKEPSTIFEAKDGAYVSASR